MLQVKKDELTTNAYQQCYTDRMRNAAACWRCVQGRWHLESYDTKPPRFRIYGGIDAGDSRKPFEGWAVTPPTLTPDKKLPKRKFYSSKTKNTLRNNQDALQNIAKLPRIMQHLRKKGRWTMQRRRKQLSVQKCFASLAAAMRWAEKNANIDYFI